jgi:ankyrin repeat protein
MNPSENLMNAVRANDRQTVQSLLDADPACAAARTGQDEGPILAAAYRGHQDLLDLLLPRAALDLFEAAAVGQIARVRELTAADPALVRQYSFDGWTALHLAAFFAHADIAAHLLDRGADLSARSTNPTANTPLHAALAGKTDRALVELFIARGADVNANAAHEVTPLHLAASRGDAHLTQFLHHHGANPNAKMQDGATPAALAQQRGHHAVSEQLRTYETSAPTPGA